MFVTLANSGNIASAAQQICKNLQANLAAAEGFYQWLSAQADTDFAALPYPLPTSDITVLRESFADLHALYLLAYGHPAPSSYNITGTYDFSLNIKEIVGPA